MWEEIPNYSISFHFILLTPRVPIGPVSYRVIYTLTRNPRTLIHRRILGPYRYCLTGLVIHAFGSSVLLLVLLLVGTLYMIRWLGSSKEATLCLLVICDVLLLLQEIYHCGITVGSAIITSWDFSDLSRVYLNIVLSGMTFQVTPEESAFDRFCNWLEVSLMHGSPEDQKSILQSVRNHAEEINNSCTSDRLLNFGEL